jgi:hypothetical protein
MSATQLLLPPVLLASGMAAGVMMWTQLGGWPLLASLPPDRYVATHAFFARKYDPFMPTCILITVAGGIALAVSANQQSARLLFAVSALLAVCSIVISVGKNVPVNKWQISHRSTLARDGVGGTASGPGCRSPRSPPTASRWWPCSEGHRHYPSDISR